MKILQEQTDTAKASPDYNFLEKIFNNTTSSIVVLSLDGLWLKVNDRVCKLFGYSRNELYNMDFQTIVYRDDLGVHEGHYDKLVNGTIDNYEVVQRYFHKNGTLIWTLLSASLVRKDNGQPSYLIWQFTDISERKKNQETLKTMLEVTKEQNSRLKSFAEITTHNLRSHAFNLQALMDFLSDDNAWLLKDENFIQLTNAVENLEETVSHLTQVAKIKAIDGAKLKTLNLHDFVEKAIYNIVALANNTNATISNTIHEDHEVKGIPAYLDSIILNFLTNAIKYRDEDRPPKIELSSEIQNEYVVFNIKDNGLGIDMDKYGDQLFQIYKTFHCKDDALGIGLFITKNHIESLGGKVIVTSEVDVGSEFSIYLQKA